MIPSVNLIPTTRLKGRHAKFAIRAWVIVIASLAPTLAAASFLLTNSYSASTSARSADLARAAERTDAARKELLLTSTELAALTRKLAAAKNIREHPDWSILLTQLAMVRGGNIILARLELAPHTLGPAPIHGSPTRYTLRLSGIARDHAAATTFSLQIEHTGIFSKVQLTETSAQDVNEQKVIAYTIECDLQDCGANHD